MAEALQPTATTAIPDGATAEAPMVRLSSIFKVYDMGGVDVAALDGVDLTVQRGEFVSIVGVSGSGKSTLLHILGCLDTPTSGSYELEGHDVTRLPDRELSRVRNRRTDGLVDYVWAPE